MEEKVRAEYERIVKAAVIKHGSLVSTRPSSFDWTSGDDFEKPFGQGRRHSATCGIKSTGRLEEDACWYEFMGTFYEGDNSVHGMEVHGVTCNCGKITDRTFRWKESLGEAIRLVMTEMLEQQVLSEEELKEQRRIAKRDACCGSDLCIFDDRGFGQNHD